MEDLIGKELGQYQIEAKLGQGGMASVFKAYQPSLNRYVAVKVLPPHFVAKDPSFIKRFQREAEAIARLHHPNILPVYDFGIDQHYSYLVMRYVEGGQTLSQVFNLSLSQEQMTDLISQIANALAYAHNHGVIHRDVKPSNILLDGGWALLSDFGLAKINEAVSRITDTGRGIGTPAYMSPEQMQGAEIDHRTDIYALGVILYEMLTNAIPHQAPTPIATMFKRVSEPPPSPRTLNPDIPESVEQVILRSLAINPEERYDSATDFAAALRQATGGNLHEEMVVDLTDKKTFIFASPAVTKPNLQRNLSNKKLSRLKRNSIWLGGGIIGLVAAVALILWSGNISSLPAASQVESTHTAPAMAVVLMTTNSPTLTPTWTPTLTPLPPTVTATFTPPPTFTPATGATSSALPPTFTPKPTVTPIPTFLPTTNVVAPTFTPTSNLPNGTFTLLNPLSLETPSYGPTTFEWLWQGAVPPGLGFEVRVWREGEPPAGVHDAVLDNQNDRIEQIGENQYRLNVDISGAAGVKGRSGEYLWTVALVQINPNYRDLGQQAPPIRLRFEAGGGSPGGGGSNGGDSGGSPGGGIK